MYLQELTSRVWGELMQEGFVIVIADDLHVCGNTVSEIFHSWLLVLHRMHENNLNPSLYGGGGANLPPGSFLLQLKTVGARLLKRCGFYC